MAEKPQGITAITVGGYKSIRDETTIEIRPLTILAGANSSGKSSIMQPMLMMKQTLDATYDPGPLRIDGPNVTFTEYEQFVPKSRKQGDHVMVAAFKSRAKVFAFNQEMYLNNEFTIGESNNGNNVVRLSKMSSDYLHSDIVISPEMTSADITRHVPYVSDGEWEVVPKRCFLYLEKTDTQNVPGWELTISHTSPFVNPASVLEPAIATLIHVPGLRGIPSRAYPVAHVQGPGFPGHFQHYVGSLLLQWLEESDASFSLTEKDLIHLNLTKWVKPQRVDDTRIEILVGRLPVSAQANPRDDLVNIADVGIGVSQVLPVIVALIAAQPGQMVYIEQPEMHLHPNAQVALAGVIADAAKRGVRVVAETHSSLLLQGAMTLIAQDKLDHEDVMLHWFTRDDEGYTKVDSVEPDRNGAYGDWPEDFGDVELDITGRYLDAVADRELVT
ncbi:MAG: AAA family ATPase [Anaerolineaceae bacterium]|nr:AAA family ATPase [Anaerolineaceae bacterium]